MNAILKRLARHSVVQGLTRSLVVRLPLQKIPKSIGLIHNIRVPKGTPRLKTRTTSAPANINIICSLVEQVLQIPGNLAECGVHQGKSLIATALYLRDRTSGKKLFGFDSFEGFNESIGIDLAMTSDKSLASHVDMRVGGFSDTCLATLEDRILAFRLESRIKLFPGYFSSTLQSVEAERFCFVSIDCDIYSSYRECLEFFAPRMSPGGIILLDEYHDRAWPGCNKAVDEFLSGTTFPLQEIERDNHVKYYIQF